MGSLARSSSREVRIRVPFVFSVVYFSRRTLPTKKGVRKGTTGGLSWRTKKLFGGFGPSKSVSDSPHFTQGHPHINTQSLIPPGSKSSLRLFSSGSRNPPARSSAKSSTKGRARDAQDARRRAGSPKLTARNTKSVRAGEERGIERERKKGKKK